MRYLGWWDFIGPQISAIPQMKEGNKQLCSLPPSLLSSHSHSDQRQWQWRMRQYRLHTPSLSWRTGKQRGTPWGGTEAARRKRLFWLKGFRFFSPVVRATFNHGQPKEPSEPQSLCHLSVYIGIRLPTLMQYCTAICSPIGLHGLFSISHTHTHILYPHANRQPCKLQRIRCGGYRQERNR